MKNLVKLRTLLFTFFIVGGLTACGSSAGDTPAATSDSAVVDNHDGHDHNDDDDDHSHDHDHDHDDEEDHEHVEFTIEGNNGMLNIYSSRHFEADEDVFRLFTEETGIGVNVIAASEGSFVERLRIEGSSSLADLVIAADAGIISFGKSEDMWLPVHSHTLEDQIPANFRDPDETWFAMTYRGRVIATVDPTLEINSYLDLAEKDYPIILRAGNHIYNRGLLASIIDIYGYDAALDWAFGVMSNSVRTPQGNDRGNLNAIYGGLADVTLINSYYLGLMLTSDNPEERMVGENIHLIFPTAEFGGTHINISAMAVPTFSNNPEAAVLFMEFITRPEIQTFLSTANFEFPVNPDATVNDILADRLPFDKQNIDLSSYYENLIQAVEILNIVGW